MKKLMKNSDYLKNCGAQPIYSNEYFCALFTNKLETENWL